MFTKTLKSGVTLLIFATLSASVDAGPLVPIDLARSKEQLRGTADTPKHLLERRVQVARLTFHLQRKRVLAGLSNVDVLAPWSRRWLKAELALIEKKAERIGAFERHLDRTKEIKGIVTKQGQAGIDRGSSGMASSTAVDYYLIEAEILLIQAGGMSTEPKRKAE
jgi:hypothetical protein